MAPMPRPAIKAMRIPNPHARTTEDRPFISPTREKVPREYEFGNSYSITAGWGIRRLAVSIQPDVRLKKDKARLAMRRTASPLSQTRKCTKSLVARNLSSVPLPGNTANTAGSSKNGTTLVARNTRIGTRVRCATVPDSRSEEEAMLIHCDRRATTKTGPFRPKAGTNSGVKRH